MEWNKKIRNMGRKAISEEVPLKMCKLKCSNLTILEDYGKVLDDA